MTIKVKELKEFLNKYSDDKDVYVDSYEGLFGIDKELCGCFKDESDNLHISLHAEMIHTW